METPVRDPVSFLRDQFIEKRRKNAKYSISAFARDLGLSVSFLSRLLRGERPLTVKQAVQIAALMGLDPTQTERLVHSVVSRSPKNRRLAQKLRDAAPVSPSYFAVERFKAISQWYHFAILSLTFVEDFQSSTAWIAKRLGISKIEAQDAIDRLFELGLLEQRGKRWVQTSKNLFIKTQRSELAVREFQLQMIDKSKEALKQTEQEAFEARYMAGSTLAVDRKKIPLLRERIQKFQLEIAELAKSETYTDVYHLNLHLFPITLKEKKS